MDYSAVPTAERNGHKEVPDFLVPRVSIKDKVKASLKVTKERDVTVGIVELIRFSDRLDKVLMLLGSMGAAFNGMAFTILLVIFGQVLDAFVAGGFLIHYLDTVGDFLQSINRSATDVLLDPTLLDCRDVASYYNTNSSTCDEFVIESSLFDVMREKAIYFCLTAVAVFIAAYGQVCSWITTGERQARRIRLACLSNVLRQHIGWFDTHDVVQLNSRLGDDVRKIQNGVGEKAGTLIQWSLSALSSLVLASFYGWKLCLVMLTSCPVLIVATSLYSRTVASLSEKEMTSYARAGAIAEEVFGAIRTVVAFGGQEKEAQRYKTNLDAAKRFGIRKGLVHGISQGLVWLSIFVFVGIGFWYGGKLYLEEEYNSSTVIIVVFAVLNVAYSMGMATPSFQDIVSSRVAAHGIFQLIDNKSEIDSLSEEGLKPKSITGTIQIQDVHFCYPSRPDVKVLNGLTVEARQGQTVALVGASGHGKSTTVQLLLRFYDPQKGKVMIDGIDVRELNINWLRNNVGVVHQEPILFATTIADNIRCGRPDATMEEIEEATKTANAYDFIMKLPDKFETMVGERGAHLSGGQKQRLAIARALVRNPKILLLDEATSALDTENESLVQDALEKSRQGRTTVIVAHRLSTIKTADVIVGIDQGQVSEMGTHHELMARRGFYFHLVTNQQTAGATQDEIETEIIEKSGPVKATKTLTEQISTTGDTQQKVKEADDHLPSGSYARIVRLSLRDWPAILLGCLGSCGNGMIWPAFALLMKQMIRALALKDEEEAKEAFLINLFIYIGIGFMSLVTYFLQGYMLGVAGENLTKRLRDLCFRTLLKQEISYFDANKNNVGVLTTRLAIDASLVQGMTGIRLASALCGLSSLGCGLAISFYYGWKMTLVVLCFIPVMMVSGIVQIKVAGGQAGKNQEALDGAAKIAIESTENIRTVASLTQEQRCLALYEESLKNPYTTVLRNAHIIGLLFALSQSIVFFAYVSAFVFGSYVVENGEMSIEDVFLVLYAVVMGSMGLGYATAFLPDLTKAKKAAGRIVRILDTVSAIDYTSQEGVHLNADYNAEIGFQDIEFNYPNRETVKVLEGLTLSVSPGQTVALVGASGCGKSTTVNLIERFYDCQMGQVALDSHDVKELNVRWLRQQIGIVSQEPVLFDTTIAENIAYGDSTRTVSMDEIISAARSANIHSFIASLPEGYETRAGQGGTQLSGGQKQRIAIARALVRNPKILLLDEATSALDAAEEKIVQEALDKAREGRTCIVIGHRLSTVQNADKICVVDHGKVVESGSHNELMARQGVYHKLVKKSVR